jgi:2-(1,2-epoxy-1,2-dihydrophenyl)acetyl-CoA isomerase
MPSEQLVLVQESNDVVEVTLNRPDRLNALNFDLVEQLHAALERVHALSVGAAVLTARGRSFCAGADLRDRLDSDGAQFSRRSAERTMQLQEITRLIRGASFPWIAAVQGYAMGAGVELAMSCDLIVAADDAVFAFPEVDVGLAVTGGVSQSLPLTVGPARAKALILLGTRFSGPQAHELGLVSHVEPVAEIHAAATAIAQTLAAKPRESVRLAKIALNAAPNLPFQDVLELEREHVTQLQRSPEAAGAAAAFEARRTAKAPASPAR